MVMMHIAAHCNLFGVLDAVFYCVRLLLQGEGEEEYGEGDGADGEEGEEGDDEEGDDPAADGNALRSPTCPLLGDLRIPTRVCSGCDLVCGGGGWGGGLTWSQTRDNVRFPDHYRP